MIRTLRKQFILTNMLLVFLILVVVFATLCVTSYNRLVQDSTHTLERSLDRRGDQAPPTLQIGQKPPADFSPSPMFLVRVDEDGAAALVFADSVSVGEEDVADIAALALAAGADQGVLRAYNLRYMIRCDGSETRIALIDRTSETSGLRTVLLTSLLSLAVALVAFFFVSLFLSRVALRPVERAWRQQRRFVADASHELKTPLTVILANSGILKSHPDSTVGAQMNWVENTETEAKRMKKLVDDMLFLAKADDGGEQPVDLPFNLSDTVLGAALTFESVAFERGVTLAPDIAPDLQMRGNGAQIAQLVGVLLDNAIKYSPAGGEVRVALAAQGTRCVLRVHNDGPALDEEEQQHLFERFWRADASRTREGYGLGLSIAKTIVDAHRGTIGVHSTAAAGTTFTVTLPAMGGEG